jgi:hypothetical protein
VRSFPSCPSLAAVLVRDALGAKRSGVVAAFVLLALGASSCRRGPAPSGAATEASTSPAAANAPNTTASAWIEARTGDPLELARLADLEGATRLGEVAGDAQASSEDRAAAIRAIAFLDDPTPALFAVGRLLADPDLDRSTLAMQTLAVVAPRRRPIEEVEPAAWRACAVALSEIAPGLVDPSRRELVRRALEGLAERGAVAASP